jgi:outer membrane lipase/esterase
MRQTHFVLALLTAAALAACGGNGSSGGDQSLKTEFASQVTFGDSLSDVGTYNVAAVQEGGGGKFTINGDNTAREPALTGKNWTELVAAQLNLKAPCAAQTGLDGDPAKGYYEAVRFYPECTNYAQGGARVTNQYGPHHKVSGDGYGHLTVPVATQIANHLAKGKFQGNELVTVMVGGNDALVQLGQVSAAGARAGSPAFATSLTRQLAAGATNPQTAAQAIGAAIQTESARPGSTSQTVIGVAVRSAASQPGNEAVASDAVYLPMVAKAQADAIAAGSKAAADYVAQNKTNMVNEMTKAGGELAALVKSQIIGNGANYVVLNNLPDIAGTPAGKSQSAAMQGVIAEMVNAFNTELQKGVETEPKVLYVDLYAISRDQVANPGPYGLTNTSTAACGATSSLFCTIDTVPKDTDVSHYMFADDIHPTPFEYALIAKYILQRMMVKGWL